MLIASTLLFAKCTLNDFGYHPLDMYKLSEIIFKSSFSLHVEHLLTFSVEEDVEEEMFKENGTNDSRSCF